MKFQIHKTLTLPEDQIKSPAKVPVTTHEFKNEFGKVYCKVLYLANHQAIVLEWYGYSTKNQVEPVANWVEQWCTLNPCICLLNDCTYIQSVWFDTIEWFSRIWVQKMIRLNLQEFVHIAKQGSFGDRIGVQLHKILANQVQFYSFSLREEATNWLETN